jgi:hypothetical protein
MTRYRIEQQASAVVIELTEVAGKQKELLEAFGECQSGRCSCPTNEYDKLAAMEVQPGAEQIVLTLEAKPGLALDSSAIAACLDHTVSKVERKG